MPTPRSKRDRLHQVANFLRHEFSTPYPVTLRIEKIPYEEGPCFGHVMLHRRRFIIRIDPLLPWEIAVDYLLHEWAHCHAWAHQKIDKERPDHSDEWGLAYARIYRRFYEEDGDLDAMEYPWRKNIAATPRPK